MNILIDVIPQITSGKYDRAGILPFCVVNGQIFFGFGYKKFYKVCGTIGGSYERSDVNLITTAFREVSEEIGDYLPQTEKFNVQ